MVHMDSITEEPAINLSINDTNNNGSRNDDVQDREDLDRRHSADEKPSEFANDTTNNIILYPFAHQVGGHTQLLTLDTSTLCKPLIPRELLFYLNVPQELIKFVPTYKGVVQIRKTGQGGNHQPVVYQPLRSPKSPYASRCKPGSSCTLPAKIGPRHMTADICSFPFELKVQIRPCSDEKILKKNLSQDNLLKADYISRPNEKYLLLLENVASKYQLPCILDLKMGTRQHGDDATEEKRHRQIAKCQASTSASLGLRLCGMQVYQVDSGGFLWYDKYYGRKMDENGLKCALQEYFRNGSQLNESIIDDVITRLKLLCHAVENSPSFRFYGTSLLIIHEGCTPSRSNTKKCPVDVRLIDFAHTICDYSTTSNSRSSSSPSVLKSNSAEQLSAVPKQSVPPNISEQSKLDSNAMTGPIGEQFIQINPNQSSSTKFADKMQSNCSVRLDNHDSSSQFDRENHQPSNLAISTTQVVDTEMAQGSGPNGGVDKPQQQVDRLDKLRLVDNNLLQIATQARPITQVTAQQQQQQVTSNLAENLIQYNQDHSLSETDQKPSLTIYDQEKQLANSTPTTPPSLGSRKISKTSMGPDRGLLFGLQNLMRLLDDLKSEALITSC